MQAQDLTNLLTAGLGVATVWLAIETRRMAEAARSAIELESQPSLSFKGVQLYRGQLRSMAHSADLPGLRIALRLFNPGKVQVTYAVEAFNVTFMGVVQQEATFNTAGGVVHPTEENLFFYPWFSTPANVQLFEAGEVSFKINYWSTPKQRKSLTARLKFTVKSVDPLDWEWIYEEGPVYGY